MKVKSPAGEFPVVFHAVETKDQEVVVKWRMGVWNVQGILEKQDLIWLLKSLFSRPMLIWFIVKIIFKKEEITDRGEA
ncbi:MAG: hypothetical protein ACYDG6_05410 [Thermincolia bacterium]